jgi:protein-disulfide isomerase
MRVSLRSLRPQAFSVMVVLIAACSSEEPSLPPNCVVPIGTSPTRGSADAWVTIVEFADFECYYCGKVEASITDVDQQRPDLRWVYKYFPLGQHAHSAAAALAADCANQQGMFWQMHDLLFANQSKLDDASLTSYAEILELDVAAWDSCRASADAAQRVSADIQLGEAIGVDATPTFFVNGTALAGAYPASDFVRVIDDASATAQRSGAADSDHYASIEKQGCQGI